MYNKLNNYFLCIIKLIITKADLKKLKINIDIYILIFIDISITSLIAIISILLRKKF